MMTRVPIPTPCGETPEIETGSDSYAHRFAGRAGRYLLAEHDRAAQLTRPSASIV
jgi:hypothetical protein